MDGLPEGCRVKLDRAEEHLKALYGEIRAFERNKPYRVTYEDDPKTGERVYRVTQVSSPPPRWPALIGDCVHNFRCSLDHAACHVVGTYGTPNRATEFPIVLESDRFRTRASQCFGKRARRGLKAAVERLQPYHRRYEGANLYALWQLHRLDIIDKHRQLLTTGMGRPLLSTGTPLTAGVVIDSGPFEDKADAYRVRVPFGPDGPVKMKVVPTTQVHLAEVEIDGGQVDLRVEETLNAIQDTVHHVLDSLMPFYD